MERTDSVWRKFEMMEEQAVVQWKDVLKDSGIDVVYALSPAAKGKVERPYHWLQDHLVRTARGRESRVSLKSFISTITNGFTRLQKRSRFFSMKKLLRKQRPVSKLCNPPALSHPGSSLLSRHWPGGEQFGVTLD